MPLYRYYFFNTDGDVKDIRVIEYKNDSIATERARDFLVDQTSFVAVELWRAEGFVGRIGRDGIIDNSPPVRQFIQPPSR